MKGKAISYNAEIEIIVSSIILLVLLYFGLPIILPLHINLVFINVPINFIAIFVSLILTSIYGNRRNKYLKEKNIVCIHISNNNYSFGNIIFIKEEISQITKVNKIFGRDQYDLIVNKYDRFSNEKIKYEIRIFDKWFNNKYIQELINL